MSLDKKTNNAFGQKRKADLIFCICMMALPILQYCIFYIGVNFNSILLSLKEYVPLADGGYMYKFSGFGNFISVVKDLFTADALTTASLNSLKAYLVSTLVITPLALVFSYYSIKKLPGAKFFRIVLFMPTIIASIILLFMFKVVADNIIPDIIEKIIGGTEGFKKANYQLLANTDTRFNAILVYHVFIGFGANVLLYSGAMSGVSEEIMESARLDGATDWKEFIYIILPSVWPTLTTFLITGVAGFFTNQLSLYSLYDISADSTIWTLGYYMFRNTIADGGNVSMYPYLSAMGIVFTLIAVPITLGVKYGLERLGPKTE